MTLSKVEKQIFLELVEDIEYCHDYIFAHTDEQKNLREAKDKLKRLKELMRLV